MTTTDDQVEARDIAGGVRDLLRGTGSRADSKWVRGLRQGRQSNVLFAVALRAAERRAQGRTLTDLEKSALDLLCSVMSDAEVEAAGAEYRQALADLGELPLLPTVVTSKPLTEGFSVQDFKAHVPAMVAAIKGRANCAAVDIDTLAAGGAIDSPAFTAAVEDTGFGSTVLCGALPEGDAIPDAPSYTAKLQFESFTCRKEVGDGASGRDEIYWTSGFRSDKSEGGSYQSEEFGAVEKGDARDFNSSNKVVFNALAGEFVFGVVSVWEADHSNSEWYDKLHDALNEWLNQPIWVDIVLEFGSFGKKADWVLAIVDVAIQLFVDLKEAFRNKDDLSCERAIFMDRHALATMYHRKDSFWEFNGDGHHTLRVKYAGDKPKFPVGALEYVTVRADVPSVPVSLGWKSTAPAALAVFEGKLHCCYVRDSDNDALMWSVRDSDGSWAKPQQLHGIYSNHQPALTVFQGRLWLAHTNLSGRAHVMPYTTAGGWDYYNNHDVPGYTNKAPALTPQGDQLRCAFRNADDGWLLMRHANDGKHWFREDNWFWNMTEAPSMTTSADNATTWMVMRGNDGRNYLGVRPANAAFVSIYNWDWGNIEAPTITRGHQLWVAGRGSNGDLLLMTRRSTNNTDWRELPPIPVGAMRGEIAISVLDGALYAMYRRP
ncbi:hypothetical protein ACWGIU_07335 [Streptomyces sp. NPDC054840]